ncbi:MAG: helix-turn-helix domain-containing protein [Polyangiaceae bacterium]
MIVAHPALRTPPNPPEIFEGRDDELAWVAARLSDERRALSIVWGAPALGKTALVLSALERARVREVVLVEAADYPSDSAFLGALARGVAEAAGVEFVAGARGPELIPWIVSTLDRVEAPIVLEDLHALGEAVSEALLARIASSARAGRVLATTRRRPRHDALVERTLVLDPLPGPAIERIVRRVRPKLEDATVRAIVERAAGSPRLAKQDALGLDVRRTALDGLDDEARALVLALAHLETSVDVARAASRFGDAAVESLVVFGFAEVGPSGLRAVSTLRPLVLAAASADDRAGGLRAALALVEGSASAASPTQAFEVVRLTIALGDFERAADLLETSAPLLLAHGYGEALFDLLVPDGANGAPARALRRAALRVASWLCAGRALAWANAQEPPEDPRDRPAWCSMLAHGGDLARAEQALATLLDDPTMEPMRGELALIHADVVSWSGAPARAIALLEALELSAGGLRAVGRDLRLVAAYVRGGRSRDAALLLDAAIAAHDALPAEEQSALRHALVSALLATSSFARADRLLGGREPPVGSRAAEIFTALAIATERGHVALAQKILETARAFAESSLSLRFAARYNDVRLRLFFGPFAELDVAARAVAADDRLAAVPDFAVYAHGVAVHATLLLGAAERAASVAWERPLEGSNGALIDAWHALVDLRARGETTRAIATRDDQATPELELALLRTQIEHAIAASAWAAANDDLDRALSVARAQGLALEELALLALRLDVRALEGSGPEDHDRDAVVLEAAAELTTAALRVGALRFEVEAQLFRLVFSSDARRPEPLEALADQPDQSPVAARRAAALLGRGAVVLDAVDRRVVALFSERLAADRPVFMLDLEAKRARLPSGLVVDLKGSPLQLRVLEVLLRLKGRATKAELAERAWGVTEYHPHRDDRRLHVGMHRLRHLIEADPKKPTLLLSEGHGYRVTAPMCLGAITA